jgi:putative DNA methylase
MRNTMSKTKQVDQPNTSSINSKGKRFIEEQFPINRLSKESYKERKAVAGQTLTGIGKWWGRKPLILVRATLLGLLMPASGDKRKDAEIFLKILMMDNEATWLRLKQKLSPGWVLGHSEHPEKEDWFDVKGKYPKWSEDIDEEEKTRITKETFLELPYEQRIELCNRPEEMDAPSEQAWEEINAHLGTNASSLTELFQQLGKNQFGYTPRAGDAFSGGGSIPFETARLGLDTFASDLNPVAGLLTYTSLNLIGGSEEQGNKLKAIQEEIFKKVDAEINQLGIEHNSNKWRAEYFLYCNETVCPECNWTIPLLPNCIIADGVQTICKLEPDAKNQNYRITIHTNVSNQEFAAAKKGTVGDGKIICPHCNAKTPVNVIRGDIRTEDGTRYGLRQWKDEDIVPQVDDVFKERLYCIRWVEIKIVINKKGEEKEERIIHFTEPNKNDLKRESDVLNFLTKNFNEWQKKGYIPSLKIDEKGIKTQEPIRNRGWNYWHQLFCPRQLLLIGLFSKAIDQVEEKELKVFLLNLLGRLANWNSRLSRWLSSQTNYGNGKDTYYNMALNTMVNFSCRGFNAVGTSRLDFAVKNLPTDKKIFVGDCRNISDTCDFWITDPPYADAVNYHELGDFFLAWYEKYLPKLFPYWYSTSQKDRAVKGSGTDFINSMIECYSNLTRNMSDDGLQVVMFTHTNPEVWADLAMILWAAGLQVTASWNIATETAAGGVKEGNYVQSTALLICRKRKSDELKFKDELTKPIKQEVEKQLQAMRDVDVQIEKNFTDVDYFNAASASALKVITGYQIAELNAFEVLKKREAGIANPLENLIQIGRRVAATFLRPMAIDEKLWDELNEYEKFYLKGLDIECQGDNRIGTFQDLAKGLGVANYSKIFANIKANSARMRTAEEFGTEGLNDGELGQTLLRKVLFAVYKSIDKQNVQEGQNFLLTEYGFDYQANKSLREKIFSLLDFFAQLHNQLPHWQNCSATSKLFATAMKNESL